jgi:hypothetical protein
MTGHSSRKNWEICYRTNTTYNDCPIANYAFEKNYTMSVAIHNPSNVELSVAEIMVANATYDIRAYNMTT